MKCFSRLFRLLKILLLQISVVAEAVLRGGREHQECIGFPPAPPERNSVKECPDDIDKKKRYSVDEENPRIATRIGDYWNCTIIGYTPLPLNTVIDLVEYQNTEIRKQ